MIFSDFKYILFFLILYLIYWVFLRGDTSRKRFLLGSSYLFYSFWDYRFLLLVFCCTAINYAVGIVLNDNNRNRKPILVLGLLANLVLLGYFKYFDFFISPAVQFLSWLGFTPHLPSLNIILPIGISFFTFKAMSYCVDVYRRILEPEKNILDFSLYIAFFPQLLAGPIERATHFLRQAREPKTFSIMKTREGINLFVSGFIKKAIVADNISPVVDRVFSDVGSFSTTASSIAIVLYTIQIYCDFSGYSDMANGSAKLLGYRIVPNFEFPYFSQNIAVFWRRWHITLSYWFRDYVYIPLGGSRVIRGAGFKNVMLTMCLCGLWHGAGWNYMIWGGLHGLAIIAHRIWINIGGLKENLGNVFSKSFYCIVTLYFVCITWIFFRSTSLSDSLIMLRRFVFFDQGGEQEISLYWLLFSLFVIAEYWLHALFKGSTKAFFLPNWAYCICLGALVSVLLLFVPLTEKPFIYFQF